MNQIIHRMDRAWYPNHSNNWDDQLFREAILLKLKPDMTVLDLGAGAGIVKQMNFRGLAGLVCGVDLDPRVTANPFLDEGKVSDAGGIPYPEETFDIVFSDNMMEHIDKPVEVLREVNRVLKQGGVFMFKTPNKWHYMPTIARLTPHAFHQFVNRLRGRAEADTFPTRYRANTKSDVIRLAEQSGFQVVAIDQIEGRPEYLRFSPVTYFVGMVYERFVNSSELLSRFRVLLISTLQK